MYQRLDSLSAPVWSVQDKWAKRYCLDKRRVVFYCVAGGLVLFVLGLLLNGSTRSQASHYIHSLTEPAQYQWNSTKDHYNLGLKKDQCDAAFSDMFYEIERAAATRNGKKIKHKELKVWMGTMIHIMIYDAQIRIIDAGAGVKKLRHLRAVAILSTLNLALRNVDPLTIPNVEFVLDMEDGLLHNQLNAAQPVLAWCRRVDETDPYVWLMPDYESWAMPASGSYRGVREKIETFASSPFLEKIPKLIWRGAVHSNPEMRGSLVEESKNKPWADVSGVHWAGSSPKDNLVEIQDFCKYQFTAYTDGFTWSGRLRYLLNCNSALVMPPAQWITPISHFLTPAPPIGQKKEPLQGVQVANFIPVSEDFKDLDDTMQYYLNHREEAEQIAKNMYSTFAEKYVTPAAEACYWRKLIQTWASLQDFEPQGMQDGKFRGLSFELWLTRPEEAEFTWDLMTDTNH